MARSGNSHGTISKASVPPSSWRCRRTEPRGQRTTLEVAQTQLAQERETWETRLQAAEVDVARAQAARDLAEHACARLDSQLQDSHALRTDLLQQRDRLQCVHDGQAEELRQLRVQLDEHGTTLREERARQDLYVQAIEDRAHQEIDRARQEAKQWQQRFEASERNHLAAATELEAQRDSARDQLRVADKDIARQAGQIAALEKALADAHSRVPQKRLLRNASNSGYFRDRPLSVVRARKHR